MCPEFEEFHVVVSSDATSFRVQLRGELDLASVEVVREVLDAAIASGAGDVDVDMSATRFCDSVGLCALLTARSQLDRGGRRLRIVHASHAVHRMLELAGVDQLIGPAGARAVAAPRLPIAAGEGGTR